MKKFIFSVLTLALVGLASPLSAQKAGDAESMLKKLKPLILKEKF